jgi:hypothetical protein
MGTARSMPGNASKSSRRRYLKKIYLLYVMWRAMRCGHYVGGLLGQQKVSYGWVGTAGDIEFKNSCEQ